MAVVGRGHADAAGNAQFGEAAQAHAFGLLADALGLGLCVARMNDGKNDGELVTSVSPREVTSAHIAPRIREQTEGVRLRSLPELRITSSIGVAPADHRHSSLRAWIDAADTALYAAKNGGRNRVAGSIEPDLAPAL